MEYIEKQNETAKKNPLELLWSFKTFVLVTVAALFYVMVNYLPFELPINQGFALLLMVSIFWFTEVFSLSVTALLIPIISVYLGIFDTKTAMSSFSHPVIYLFFGGFVIAAAIHSQGIDKVIAQRILLLARGHLGKALVLLFSITAFFSMWISNIATTTIMLPLVLGLLGQLDSKKDNRTYVFALLGIAFSANIGGLGTVVGCASNAIAASYVGIAFFDWMKFGLPTVMIMMPIMIGSLYVMLKPNLSLRCDTEQNIEPLSSSAKLTAIIFLLTAFCWINSKTLAVQFGNVKHFDSVIGLSAAVILVMFGLVDWNKIQRGTDWGVLILFGGGITLSEVLKTTGTSNFLAESIANVLSNIHPIFFILATIIFVMILTQFTSNTASATLLVPIFGALADSFGLSPVVVAAIVAMSTSFAFMLPVATPPNAIVYGTGFIQQSQMLRVGVLVNFLGIFVLFTLANILL